MIEKNRTKNWKNMPCFIFLIVFIFTFLFFIKKETLAASPIIINNDVRYTNSRYVTLKLNAASVGIDALKIMLSNTSNWSDWLPYRSTYHWKLAATKYGSSQSQGMRRVSVKFRDVDGNVSRIYRDRIVYDSQGPRGSVRINNNASFTTKETVKLTLVATDKISGVRWVKISNDGKKWTPWITFNFYRKNFNWDLSKSKYGGNRLKGRKCVYVKFKDKANNGSSVKKDCISYVIKRHIEIDLSSQYLYLWYGGRRIKKYRISSGRPGMETPTGTFHILSKSRLLWSTKYSLYMPYSLRFYNGYFIHELPYWPGGYREGQWHLGIPVSHGCVRLGIGPAKTVYRFALIGTKVIIHK